MRGMMRRVSTGLKGTLAVGWLGLAVWAASGNAAQGENPSTRRSAGDATTPRKASGARLETAVLEQVGLAGFEATGDSEGRRVRGAYGGSWTSGMSFVAGMLFDPDTASNLRGSSANSSEAFAVPYRFLPSRTESAQISGLQLALTISQGGVPTFSGSLYGIANGFGVTRP